MGVNLWINSQKVESRNKNRLEYLLKNGYHHKLINWILAAISMAYD